MSSRPPVIAADVLAARPPEQQIAALEVKLGAERAALDGLLERMRRSLAHLRAEADAIVIGEDETPAAAYVRGSAAGTATGLGIAVQWLEAHVERTRRGA